MNTLSLFPFSPEQDWIYKVLKVCFYFELSDTERWYRHQNCPLRAETVLEDLELLIFMQYQDINILFQNYFYYFVFL